MNHQSFVSTVIHRYLRVPYALNAQVLQAPKKPRDTYVLIHGIGNTLHAWDELVMMLPKDVKIIGIDLLGFGASPKPQWALYSAKTQARSVALTIINLKLTQRPILIGHSLGALVAVEIAKRYPLFVKELVLCSPPFYHPEIEGKRWLTSHDDRLRRLYRLARKYPEQIEKFSPTAVKFGLANRAFNVTKDTIQSYLSALESSIINQTSLKDIAKLKLPIMIFYGGLDPVVVGKNITSLAKTHTNITIKRLVAGHEVVGSYTKSLAKWLSSRAG